MRGALARKKRLVFLVTLVVAGATAIAAYAALPSRTVTPTLVPAGTLAGATSVDVYSVDAFTRAINQAHGTTAVLQHVTYTAGQQTLWHTHPGPNIVLVVGGKPDDHRQPLQLDNVWRRSGLCAPAWTCTKGSPARTVPTPTRSSSCPPTRPAIRTPAPGISADPPPCAS